MEELEEFWMKLQFNCTRPWFASSIKHIRLDCIFNVSPRMKLLNAMCQGGSCQGYVGGWVIEALTQLFHFFTVDNFHFHYSKLYRAHAPILKGVVVFTNGGGRVQKIWLT